MDENPYQAPQIPSDVSRQWRSAWVGNVTWRALAAFTSAAAGWGWARAEPGTGYLWPVISAAAAALVGYILYGLFQLARKW